MQALLQRRTVVQQLLDEPYRFQFFQAVSLLVKWLVTQGVPTERALIEHLFFENNVSFAFAASQILELDAGLGTFASEGGMVHALARERALQIRITPAFMGFLGPNGTLPSHYTEQFGAYLAATRDEAPRAFLDMFSNRALAQFYTAWRKHRIEHAGDVGEDAFLPLLLSFAGSQASVEVSVEAIVHAETIARYAGVTMQRPVPPDVLCRVLSDYLEVPLAIEESVGSWIVLEGQEQCSLGGRNAVLGNNTLLGDRSWRPDLRARISIGPLDRGAFDHLLPGGVGEHALAHLLRLFGDPTVSYDVHLILKAVEINPLCLSGSAPCPIRLGVDSFLVEATERHDRSDMHYRITPLPPLSPLAVPASSRRNPS